MSNLAIKLETIQFHNQSLIVLNHQNKPYVAMKPICENIGLDWEAQRQRIKRHHVLSKGAFMIKVPSKGGEQQYLCLPISMINGWLFGIDTNRVKQEIRPTLEQYQLECFDVLYNHFMPKVAQQFPNTITTEQQHLIRKAVDERAYRTGEKHQTIYHKLYDQFKIPRYQDLPAIKFNEAIDFLGGINVRSGLSDNDLYKLARLFVMADRMHNKIADITPALEKMFSKYADSFHSMAFHYTRELKEAKQIIQRETSHINTSGYLDDWNRVLPVIRH